MKTIIATLCVDTTCKKFTPDNRYFSETVILLNSYLKHTNFDILVTTNMVDYFNDFKTNPRVIITDLRDHCDDPLIARCYINMNLKRIPIKLASQLDYDVVYHHDCDCFVVGWDQESYIRSIDNEFDFYMPTNYNVGNRIELLRVDKVFKHLNEKLKCEFENTNITYPDWGGAPHMAETRILIKNNDKMKLFLEYWDRIAETNKANYIANRYQATMDGIYFGTCAWYAKMKLSRMHPTEFTNYCRIHHGLRILNYYGTTIALKEDYNYETQD